MPDEPLTPLQASAARTGRRYFRAAAWIYGQLAAAIDQSRGFPAGEGTAAVTLRGLPLAENMPVANDGSGDLLVSVETGRFTPADDQMLAGPISAGYVTELTDAEHEALKPAKITNLSEPIRNTRTYPKTPEA